MFPTADRGAPLRLWYQKCRQSRGLASRGSKFDDSHEDLEAGAPKVTTVTKIGNALTGSSSKRTVEDEDGAAEGAAAGAGRLAGALAGAADGADGDVGGAVATVTWIETSGAQKRRLSRRLASRGGGGNDDWQVADPKVTTVARIGKPGGKPEGSHEDWQSRGLASRGPQATTATRIGAQPLAADSTLWPPTPIPAAPT